VGRLRRRRRQRPDRRHGAGGQAGRARAVAKPFWPQLIAASIAVVAVSATLVMGAQQGWFERSAKPTQVAVNEAASLTAVGRADYVTGKGQKSIVDLPDGTRVTLDADSAVDVAFTGGRRDVRLLNGRAFFDVAHDRAHPFAVQAGGRVVTALGTQFDVRLTPGAVRVVLAEGSVSVASAPGGPARRRSSSRPARPSRPRTARRARSRPPMSTRPWPGSRGSWSFTTSRCPRRSAC
jgi:transmembrane sensor